MARDCPHCGERIEYLKYTASTRGWETGTVNDHGDFESDDSGTDDTEDYNFYCPECDTQIGRGSSWIQEEDDSDDDDSEEQPAVITGNDIWRHLA